MQYKLTAVLLVAFLVPVVAIALSGYLSIRGMGGQAAEESARTLVEAERRHLEDATRAEALEIELLCEGFESDVEHLRWRYQRTRRELGSYNLAALPDRYPGRDKAGLPGYGYVHPTYGAYADYDDRGPGGPWLPRATVARVRNDPALRARVTDSLHAVMLLDGDLSEIVRRRKGTLDLAWLVLDEGVSNVHPEYDYNALLQRDAEIADVDENQQTYVLLAGPQNNPERRTRWLKPYLDRFKGVWMTSCVAPIYDGDQFQGTVGTDILLHVITEQILRTRVGQEGYALMAEPGGSLIAIPEAGIQEVLWDDVHRDALRQSFRPAGEHTWTEDTVQAVSRSLADSPNPQLREIVASMAAGSAGIREIDLAGQRRFVSWAPVRNAGWSLALIVPTHELVAPSEAVRAVVNQGVQRTLGDYLKLGLIVTGISIAVGMLLHYLTVRPLGKFTRQVEAVHWDNLTFPLPARRRRDELGQLYAKFAEMIRLIGRARDEVTAQRRELEQANRKLLQANEELLRSVNEKQRLEEALITTQKLESVRLLAAGIAHDFNNLLTSILGNVSLSRRFAASGRPVDERLQDAEAATRRAQQLTLQLLTFSSGGAPVRKPVRLEQVLREASRFALRGSAARCELELAEDLPPVVADEGQLGQVVQNLVINGEQAMPAGGTIHIRAAAAEVGPDTRLPLRPGAYVSVEVQDSGTGIAPEALPRVFDPFFTTKPKGNGLGLAVCFSILQRHEGHITLESRPGQGTTVRFYLPAAQQPVEDAAQPRTVRGGTGRILVMDDDELIRGMAVSVLRELGYQGLAVASGQEALEAYLQARQSDRPFDAVILDLTIPGGLGGLETFQQLRELDPGLRAIVTSGYSTDAVMGSAREHGFKASLVKPFDVAALGAALASALAAEAERRG